MGRLVVTGPIAVLALVVLLLGIVALIVWERPSPRMLGSGFLWVAFVIYWNTAPQGGGPIAQAESARSRALHSWLLNVSLLLLFLPVPLLRSRFVALTPGVVTLGFSVQILGIALAIWARRHLGRNWSGLVRVREDHQLVQSGPYRLVRHPIYTAMFAMYAGTSLVSGELHALLALAILGVAYWRKIRLEERALSTALGASYDSYRRGTWALIPWLL